MKSISKSLRVSSLVLVLAGLVGASPMATAADSSAAAADSSVAAVASQPAYTLPLRPSEMLRAPLATWQPLLAQVATLLDEMAGKSATLDKPALIELHIQRTLLAQTRHDWPAVLACVEQARAAQGSSAGRQMAGLLNDVLARKAISQGDDVWLRHHLRDAVLAMPWQDVEPAIRSFRDQLAKVEVGQLEGFVARRLDLSANFAKNKVTLGFVFQLLGARFQLLEVMPSRAALVLGLDDAIAQRTGTGTAQ